MAKKAHSHTSVVFFTVVSTLLVVGAVLLFASHKLVDLEDRIIHLELDGRKQMATTEVVSEN